MSKNTYILLKSLNCYGLTVARKSEAIHTVKVPVKGGKQADKFEELDFNLADEKVGFTMEVKLTVRVIVSEQRKFSLEMSRNSNDKI